MDTPELCWGSHYQKTAVQYFSCNLSDTPWYTGGNQEGWEMQVGCTKKLLDYIGLKAKPIETQEDPALSWSANILTILHRRCVVVANDSSRYGFALYGIKSKDIKDIGGLILEGVRACLEVECIAPELIERYLDDCGSGVTFTNTANRSLVARLNQLCRLFEFFATDFTTEQLLQRQVMLRLNQDLISMKDGQKRVYFSAHERLGEDIRRRYKSHPYRCQAVEFEVELELDSPCRRRIVVPLGYTFRQFHEVLQSIFCWQRHHLHDFWIERYPNGRLKYTLVGYPREYEEEGETTRDDALVCLSEIFPDHDHIIYNYDFGDNWIHHIRLVGIIDAYDKNYALCLSGEGDAPPEDVGGPGEYARLLRVLSDPKDPEHDDLKAWYASTFSRPFDLEDVNRRLKR